MPRTAAPSVTFDFEDEKFQAPPSQVLPWCQIINPRPSVDGVSAYGLAVKLDNAKIVGFTPDEDWQPVDHEFSTGEVETLLINTRPRLVVVRRSPVFIKYRDSGILLGRLSDHYDTFMADKLSFKTLTRYLVFLVGKDKKFLHQTPLRLSLSGAASASFGQAYRKIREGQAVGGFTVELEQAYADFRRQSLERKGPLFHAHGIFCPYIEVEEAGSGENTALIASTVDYEHPTGANFIDYAIASNSPEASLISETFEEYKDFGQDLPKTDPSKMPIPSVPTGYTFSGAEYDDDDPDFNPPY